MALAALNLEAASGLAFLALCHLVASIPDALLDEIKQTYLSIILP